MLNAASSSESAALSVREPMLGLTAAPDAATAAPSVSAPPM